HLTVGHDVQAGLLLCPDGEQGRVPLGLLQVGRAHPPQFPGADAGREAAAQPLPVDQPVRLGGAADKRGGGEETGPPPVVFSLIRTRGCRSAPAVRPGTARTGRRVPRPWASPRPARPVGPRLRTCPRTRRTAVPGPAPVR